MPTREVETETGAKHDWSRFRLNAQNACMYSQIRYLSLGRGTSWEKICLFKSERAYLFSRGSCALTTLFRTRSNIYSCAYLDCWGRPRLQVVDSRRSMGRVSPSPRRFNVLPPIQENMVYRWTAPNRAEAKRFKVNEIYAGTVDTTNFRGTIDSLIRVLAELEYNRKLLGLGQSPEMLDLAGSLGDSFAERPPKRGCYSLT